MRPGVESLRSVGKECPRRKRAGFELGNQTMATSVALPLSAVLPSGRLGGRADLTQQLKGSFKTAGRLQQLADDLDLTVAEFLAGQFF